MLRRTEGNEDGKKFSRSKYELPWRLRNESLAQDPMKVAAHIAPNAINAAGERPLKPNWHSMANGDGMSRWHLTSRCTSEKNGRHRSQDQQEGRRDIQEGRSRNRRTSPTGRHSRERYAPPSACRADARSCEIPRSRTRMGLTAARASSATKRIACHAPDTITGQDSHRQNAGAEDARSGQRRADVPPRSAPLSSGKRRECGRATDSDANRPEATCRRCGTRFE